MLRAADVATLLAEAAERQVLQGRDAELLADAARSDAAGSAPASSDGFAASKGTTGDMQEELRVERLDEGKVRIARWIFRPGPREWELQEAPPMLPAKRYAEAIRAAARGGLLA